MRLFLDSSRVELWQRYRRAGWLYGATTNPLVLRREGRSSDIATYSELVADAKAIGLQELQIQTTGDTHEELTQTGIAIAGLWQHIVVKVPLTEAGLEAGANLIAQNIRVTMTAAYAVHQMLAATAMGADYIAPYFGRLLEAGKYADTIVNSMLAIRKNSSSAPRVLLASLRKIEQLESLAALGHDTFTINPNLAEQFGTDPMSEAAAIDFEKARFT